MTEHTSTIQQLNDRFRRGDRSIAGQVLITCGIKSLIEEHGNPLPDLATLVKTYDDFGTDNDPHGEHDFGAFDYCGKRCFWKIDIYDKSLRYGAEHPEDPNRSARVLTIMLAEEY